MTSIGDFRLEVFMLEDYYVKPSTVDRASQVEIRNFAQSRHVHLGVNTSGVKRLMAEMTSNFGQCQTLGQQVRSACVTEGMRTFARRVDTESFESCSHDSPEAPMSEGATRCIQS
jgi:hypothetical protein